VRRIASPLALSFALAIAGSPLVAATQRIEVRILAPAAKPLAGAAVTVVATAGEAFTASATSDDNGLASFELPSAKRAYRLEVNHADFAPFTESFDLGARRLQRGEPVRLEVELLALTAVDVFNRGVRALQEGDRGTAEAEFHRAVAMDPAFARGWSVLALAALDGRRYDEALTAADRALALEPGDTQSLRSRYDALAGLGRADDADAALSALAAADPSPELSRLLFNAGAAAANSDQPERARQRLHEALARDPSLWQAYSALAELAVREQDLERALEDLDRGLAVAPRQARIWERKIEVLRALGRTDEASAAEQQLAALRAEG
jgi:tetratricopeptide (TPR) repeat protein